MQSPCTLPSSLSKAAKTSRKSPTDCKNHLNLATGRSSFWTPLIPKQGERWPSSTVQNTNTSLLYLAIWPMLAHKKCLVRFRKKHQQADLVQKAKPVQVYGIPWTPAQILILDCTNRFLKGQSVQKKILTFTCWSRRQKKSNILKTPGCHTNATTVS